jgi:hypothetical protein
MNATIDVNPYVPTSRDGTRRRFPNALRCKHFRTFTQGRRRANRRTRRPDGQNSPRFGPRYYSVARLVGGGAGQGLEPGRWQELGERCTLSTGPVASAWMSAARAGRSLRSRPVSVVGYLSRGRRRHDPGPSRVQPHHDAVGHDLSPWSVGRQNNRAGRNGRQDGAQAKPLWRVVPRMRARGRKTAAAAASADAMSAPGLRWLGLRQWTPTLCRRCRFDVAAVDRIARRENCALCPRLCGRSPGAPRPAAV